MEMLYSAIWERGKKSSSAEVAYVITVGSKIIPIEVKARTQGHFKSLMNLQTASNKVSYTFPMQPGIHWKEIH